MIIWGFGRRTVRRHGPTVYQTCTNCRNANWFNLVTVRRWFTLFFLPVVPYSSRNLLICPVCSRGRELNGNDLAHARKLNEIAVQYTSGAISGDEYRRRMAELSGGDVPAVEAAAPPSTEVRSDSTAPTAPPEGQSQVQTDRGEAVNP